MIRPTPEQRAEMAAYIDAKQPGLLDDLGIERRLPDCGLHGVRPCECDEIERAT